MLNSPPSPIPEFIIYSLMKPMFCNFIHAIKFDCLFFIIFQSFHSFVSFIFDKLTPNLNICFRICFKLLFSPFRCKKAVSEVLKTRLFPYSAFWLTANEGKL